MLYYLKVLQFRKSGLCRCTKLIIVTSWVTFCSIDTVHETTMMRGSIHLTLNLLYLNFGGWDILLETRSLSLIKVKKKNNGDVGDRYIVNEILRLLMIKTVNTYRLDVQCGKLEPPRQEVECSVVSPAQRRTQDRSYIRSCDHLSVLASWFVVLLSRN